jgi:hypothetical protein
MVYVGSYSFLRVEGKKNSSNPALAGGALVAARVKIRAKESNPACIFILSVSPFPPPQGNRLLF